MTWRFTFGWTKASAAILDQITTPTCRLDVTGILNVIGHSSNRRSGEVEVKLPAFRMIWSLGMHILEPYTLLRTSLRFHLCLC